MKHTKQHKKSAFTLIELLVVMAIIGILAGLLFPAVKAAMNAARQMRDVNNVRSIALALITESIDGSGFFRIGLTSDHQTTDATTLDVFQGLLEDEIVDDPGVFYGYGSVAADSYTLRNENIGFQYIAGYSDNASSRLPLLITKGTGLQKSMLTGKSIPVGTSAWGTAGVAVGYVSGSSEWIKNKGENDSTLELESPLGMAKNIPDVVVYE